jgi:hypothetical protein
VHPTLEFPDLLRLIEERSNAFRALVAAAPDLDVPVPTCPGWTLFDLAQHVGQGRLRWAAIVAAGPADERPAGTAPSDAVALDGVEEFLSTYNATTSPWPHPPAVLDYHATEGRSWRLHLSPEGARFSRLPGA